MVRKKQKEHWWGQPQEEPDAETPPEAAEASEPQKDAKPKKKHRWDWMDVAGDLLEVVIDFVADLFD